MQANRQNKKSKSPPEKSSSFKEDRERALTLLWNKIPARLRVPLALIITLIIALPPTWSYWYPPVASFFDKPAERLIFDGYVFLHNKPARAVVKFVSSDGAVIRTEESDEFGHVVFNVEKNKDTYRLQCLSEDLIKTFDVEYSSLQSGSEFNIYLDEDRIEWR